VFEGFTNVVNLDQTKSQYTRIPATSGTQALILGGAYSNDDMIWIKTTPQRSFVSYWYQWIWTFTKPVSEVSFNLRTAADFEITCYNAAGNAIAGRKVQGVLAPRGASIRDVPFYKSGAPFPVERVHLSGGGMVRCQVTADGGVLDDLSFRPEQQELVLECVGDLGANSVTRGQTISCSAKAGQSTVEVEEWSFTGMDSPGQAYSFPDDIDGPITDNPWRGQMAISGVIKVRARIDGGAPIEKSVQVTVAPRNWESKDVRTELSKVSWAEYRGPRPPDYPTWVRDLGATYFEHLVRNPTADDLAFISDYGPNHYLAYYIHVPSKVTLQILVHPEMERQGTFWRRQRERRAEFEREARCVRSDFPRYIQEILQHEGYPTNPESHTGVFLAEYTKAAGPAVESLVFHNNRLGEMADKADELLNSVFVNAHAKANEPVDTAYPAEFGCIFDYQR
jgi:hypothetical protein